MAHSRAELAEFQNGESRMVYAMVRATSEIVFMPNDEGLAWRPRARAELMCLVPRCPTSNITTVHRERRRDGFRHLVASAADHKPERVFHVQGKARIAEWLRSTYRRSTTTIEYPLPERERVADVMIESPDVRRVAFEVQYSALIIKDWRDRHQSYVKYKISDVWVFGHTGDQFKTTKDDRLKLNELQRHLAEAGQLVFWLNPITGQIATAEETVYAGGQKYRIPARKEGEIRLSWLEELRVTVGGVTSDRFQELVDDREKWQAHLARIAVEEAARQKRFDEAQAARQRYLAEREAERIRRLGPEGLAKEKEQERLREEELQERLRRKALREEDLVEAARIAAEEKAERIRLADEAAAERMRLRDAAAEALPWPEKMAAVKKDLRRALRARAANTWPSSPERAEVLEHFGGEIPEWLQRNILGRSNVTPEEWHIRLYIHFFRDDSSSWFTSDDVVRHLDEEFAIMLRKEDVGRWLEALVTWKIVRFELGRPQPGHDSGAMPVFYQPTGVQHVPTEPLSRIRRFG